MRVKHGIEQVRRHAETSPAHGAIECGGLTITYRELVERLDRRQAELASVVRPGVPFVIDRPRSPEFVVDFLAVLALGGVAVPIDPRLPAGRRAILERHLTVGETHEDGAYVFFTSGSTGTPKPVLGSAAALRHFLDWQVAEFGIGAPDRVAFLTALSFDVMVRDVMLPLWAGGTLVIPEPGEAEAPEDVVAWLTRRRISVVDVVPSVARSWLRYGAAPCPSVRTVFFAGEPLTGALVEQWHATFPATRVRVNFYGTTETTLPKVYKRLRRIEPTGGLLPVGKPVPGATFTLAETGEIVLVSRYSSHGYLGLPEETSARFTRLAGGETAYRTGDLGRLDDAGDLLVVGRGDDEVKVNGVRIHPAEVAASIRAGGEVHDVFVTSGPLTAYVVPVRAPFDASAVRRDLMAVVPPAMVPARFVAVPALPQLPNGKVDRAALHRLDAAPPDTPPVPPSGELECWVAAQWAELFGTSDVGANDDFFACGGDSITAMQLAARIRHDFGVALSVRAVFANATVALLAQEIADRQLAETDPDELLELLARVERS